MAGLDITELFGATADLTAGVLTLTLSELHGIAIANNKHVLASGRRLIPDAFTVGDYDTAENILALICAAAYSYKQNNPKTDSNGTLVNDRKFDINLYDELEGTSNFEPNTFLYYNSVQIINYWSASGINGYDPSVDAV